MSKMIHCAKLNKEAEAMPRQMYPGSLGKKIFETISNEAWQIWLRQQTILINEYRLNPLDPSARKFLEEQMQQFFFGNNKITLPDQFTPEK